MLPSRRLRPKSSRRMPLGISHELLILPCRKLSHRDRFFMLEGSQDPPGMVPSIAFCCAHCARGGQAREGVNACAGGGGGGGVVNSRRTKYGEAPGAMLPQRVSILVLQQNEACAVALHMPQEAGEPARPTSSARPSGRDQSCGMDPLKLLLEMLRNVRRDGSAVGSEPVNLVSEKSPITRESGSGGMVPVIWFPHLRQLMLGEV